jgi:glyoxylase-like metal-dependent hydrolase (beta-lactamase superfamily II)
MSGGRWALGREEKSWYADDLCQIRASMKKLLDFGATTFSVGHGGPFYAERVRAWLGRVESS